MTESTNVAITVIVPMYNVAKYIEKCALSLLGQMVDNMEIIFVDDCSSDDTVAVLERVITSVNSTMHGGKTVRVIRNVQNMGSSASRNVGIVHATGEYLGFCDSDDWVDADMYKKLLDKARREDADIVCCGMMLDEPEGSKVFLYSYEQESKADLWHVHVLYSSLCNKIVKRSLYDDNNIRSVEGLSMWDDHAVSFRLRYYSAKTLVVNKPYYHYVGNLQSLTHSPDMIRMVNDHVWCISFLVDNMSTIAQSDSQLRDILEYFKLEAKMPYLEKRQVRNSAMWKCVFPETNSSGWKCCRFSKRQRIKMATAFIMPSFIANKLLSTVEKCMDRLKF